MRMPTVVDGRPNFFFVLKMSAVFQAEVRHQQLVEVTRYQLSDKGTG